MPFGFIASLVGGAIQSSQQAAEIRRQEKIAEDRLAFDQKVYDWQNLVSQTQYQYDLMRVNALREADALAGQDYVRQQEMVIEQAVQNYAINRQAIFDQFVTGERLRAKQDQLEFRQQNRVADRNLVEQMRQQSILQKRNLLDMQAAGNANRFQQDLLGVRAQEIARESSYEAAVNGLQLTETVRQLIQSGAEIRNSSDVRARGAERAVSEVMSSIAIEEGTDNFGWQLQQVQAMLEDGVLQARASASQGDGATARRLSIQTAQALGRTWGQQVLRSRARGLRLNLANELITKELAGQSAGDVLRLEGLKAQAGYEVASSGLRNANIIAAGMAGLKQTSIASQQSATAFAEAMSRGELAFNDIMGAQRFALKAYRQDAQQRNRVMEKLTIPSYRLARRQGIREAQALYLRTKGTIDNASLPYRGGVFFDPVAPIPGPMPERSGTGNFSSPGFGQILASNLAAAGGQALAGALPGLLGGSLFGGGGGGGLGGGFDPAAFSGQFFLAPNAPKLDLSGFNPGSMGNVTFNPGAFAGPSLLR